MAETLPGSAGVQDALGWMLRLRELALEWLKDPANAMHTAPTAQTPAYVDLACAFGLARLGGSDAARELIARAETALVNLDDAHGFLLRAYRYRIQQAVDGKYGGPLSAQDMEYLEHMERLQRYIVDRLRKHSRILEPEQRINPARHLDQPRRSEFENAVVGLADLADPHELARRVDKLLGEVPKGAEPRARVVRAGLEAAPRVGEDFALRMLDQAIPAYDALPEARKSSTAAGQGWLGRLVEQADLLEKSLFVATHFVRVEKVYPLLERAHHLLAAHHQPAELQALNSLVGQCVKSLRRLRLAEELDQLLQQVREWALQGQDIASVDFSRSAHGPGVLLVLLHLAAGWSSFGWDSLAGPVLQKTASLLRQDNLSARDRAQLACAYADCLSQAPAAIALSRLEEVFLDVRGVRDTYTTSSHFSVSQLELVEAVVLAAVEALSGEPVQ